MNKDTKIEHYRSLKGPNYPIVEKLTIDQYIPDKQYPYEASLALTLRNRSNSDGSRFILELSKVRDLRLNPGNLEISFSLLTIIPINDGWENVHFKVFNDEQDVEFSCFCDDFTATIVESLG